ncbi:hypothetical protein [Bacillus haynesii]|uniref:hypothetical protein n=1 Tax=Bacillus haynesii TaxID=1925021 RepID=UPI003D090260
MFFKDADPKGKKAADAACRAAFIFWAVILFVNTTFEYFDREPLISNFSFLLGLGLAVFFFDGAPGQMACSRKNKKNASLMSRSVFCFIKQIDLIRITRRLL